MANAPMETKVKAAGWSTLVAAFIVGLVIQWIPGLADSADIIQAAIVAALAAGAAWYAGYRAKHSPRPDDRPPATGISRGM